MLTKRLKLLVAAWRNSANEEAAKRTIDAVGVAAGIRGCIVDLERAMAASAAPAEGLEKIESALRILMGTINAYEKETGVGGWYAERVQEASNYLLKAHGSEVRFGLVGENPLATAPTMSDAARDVLAERQRQVEVEGWTPEHDDEHDAGEMALAGAAYAAYALIPNTARDLWPWLPKWWKPKTPRRNLVKAAALAIAEIERIDRAAAKPMTQAEYEALPDWVKNARPPEEA